MLRGNCIHKITSPVSRVRTCGLGFAHLPPSLSRLEILYTVLETQNLKLQSTHTCGYIRLRSLASFLIKILYSTYSMLDPQNLKLQKRNSSSSSSWQRAMMLPPKGLSGLINSLIRAGPIEIHGSLHMILVSNTSTVCTSDYINSYCISTRVMINKVSSLLPFQQNQL